MVIGRFPFETRIDAEIPNRSNWPRTKRTISINNSESPAAAAAAAAVVYSYVHDYSYVLLFTEMATARSDRDERR